LLMSIARQSLPVEYATTTFTAPYLIHLLMNIGNFQ
jgi:hypothetical protein